MKSELMRVKYRCVSKYIGNVRKMMSLTFKFFSCQIVTFTIQGSKSIELLEKEYGKVILVNAIFRHGQRSVIHSYPTDPYASYKWPDGKGQLLQMGKQRAFQEGEWFKNRYRRLLETVNSHTNITMISSELDRAIMTGQCFMAGFFTPKPDQILLKNLKWDAVPIHSNAFPKDNILRMKPDCPMHTFLLEKYFKSKLAENIFDKYQKIGLFHTLQKHSGFKFTRYNTSDCYEKMRAIFDVLSVQSANNFKLPSWTKKIFPELLKSAKTRLFAGQLRKLKMKILTAGPLLKAITENMVEKQKHKSTRIFHFYSGHDHILIYIMDALKIFNNIWPPCSSCLVFELREKKSEKFVTIFYKNSTTSDPIYLHLPHCKKEKICPLKTFLRVTKHLIPKDMDLECKIPKN